MDPEVSELALAIHEARECDQTLLLLLTQVYKRWHNDPQKLELLGQLCHSEYLYQQAWYFLSCAIEASPLNPRLCDMLRYVEEKMLDRWHFLMINDVQRNSSYFKAIIDVIHKLNNPIVLDIGAGTGLLRYRLICNTPSTHIFIVGRMSKETFIKPLLHVVASYSLK